ncbi:hypothetical protein ACLOJK_038795 [Asimina triloba]
MPTAVRAFNADALEMTKRAPPPSSPALVSPSSPEQEEADSSSSLIFLRRLPQRMRQIVCRRATEGGSGVGAGSGAWTLARVELGRGCSCLGIDGLPAGFVMVNENGENGGCQLDLGVMGSARGRSAMLSMMELGMVAVLVRVEAGWSTDAGCGSWWVVVGRWLLGSLIG